jgi:hypothetical protein
MAIQQGLTLSFRQDILQAGQNLLTDTLYIALYTGFSDIGANTTVYTITNEVIGTGYAAGGIQLTGATIQTSTDGVVFVNFASPSWANATFTARGALIYNVTRSNKSIAVLDFGSDKTCNNQTFTVPMPVNTATTALIRFY